MSSTPTPARPRPLRAGDVSASAVVAGFVAVAISYSGPLLVVLEAARQSGVGPQLTTSWVWAISVGSGLACAVLSLVTRQPVMVAWSIPGAALLITSLGQYRFSDAVGAYVVCGLLSLALGVTGLVGRLLATIPRPVTAAVLAGVLLPFSVKVAAAVVAAPLVAGGLVVGYLVGRRFFPRYAVFGALAVGGALALLTGSHGQPQLQFSPTVPTWTTPTFSLDAVLGIGLPLFIVTQAGQNAPGLIVMHNGGYAANDRLLLGGSGLVSALFAPFGGHALNLAAVTAAICTSPEAHPDRDRRYVAAVACGVFYIVSGAFAATIVGLFGAIPPDMITALAGVALLGALQNSLYDTMHEAGHHPAVIEAALIAFVVTVSGVAPFGIVSAFWGLLAGVAAYAVLCRTRRAD